MRIRKSILLAASCALAFACQQGEDVTNLKPVDASPLYRDLPANANARISQQRRYAVFSAEYLTTGESAEVGRTIFFSNVGNKQLAADFVPGTSLDGTDAVSYYIDAKRPSMDLAPTVTAAAITRAMNTWNGVICSDLGIYQIPFSKRNTTGFISELFGFGGSLNYVADVVHAGWLGAEFFDLVGPQGSTYILGVTFTIIFTDDNGNPTDVDNNGKLDVAWREIYYNDAFAWADHAHYDVETIALHESGHGLSQEHFGTAFLDSGTGKLHFSPLAVMNAAYSGIQTQIGETDNAGHCSIWSSWPTN